MKTVSIIIFDNFTDIDLFFIWDILGRNKNDWQVKILGTKSQHVSFNGLTISTHGHIQEANNSDIVLFSSGKGSRKVIKDTEFLTTFSLDPSRQLIGSICSGALILAKLGLLKDKKATTHPKAKAELQAMGIETVDLPFVCNGNVATAGGCLSAQYLVSWVIVRTYGREKIITMISDLFPVGQTDIYENLIHNALASGETVGWAERSEAQQYF